MMYSNFDTNNILFALNLNKLYKNKRIKTLKLAPKMTCIVLKRKGFTQRLI